MARRLSLLAVSFLLVSWLTGFLSACASSTPLLQRLSPPPISTPTPKAPPPAGLLPHSLYFLAPDEQGVNQVWKLAADGVSLTQVSFEPENVTDFSVSPATGDLVYLFNNRLVWLPAGSTKPAILLDGGSRNALESETTFIRSRRISSPIWSPNGNLLAYGQGGINLLDAQTKQSKPVLGNLQENLETSYSPLSWSPDGSQLLVEVSQTGSGPTLSVLDLATTHLMPLKTIDDPRIIYYACCQAAWSADGQSIYIANPYRQITPVTGLWRFEARTGSVETLIPPTSPDDSRNLAGWPLEDPTGRLLFFYTNIPDQALTSTLGADAPLTLAAIEQAGQPPRLLRPETFAPREILWSPKGDAALMVQAAPGANASAAGGPVLLVRTSGGPPQPLIPLGFHLRWGP